MLSVEFINWFLAAGTIAMQVIAIALALVYVWRDRYPLARDIAAQVGRLGLWAAFVLALAGSALTLYYSEIVGYVPCGLCWLVRVFVYPQVILFALALYKQDRSIADYSLALSVPGAIVALYTHYLQMGGASLVPCPASGVADCGKRLVFEFGYVTMPMMGLTLIVLLIILMLFVRRSK